jgi:hypothetical protein
LARKQQDAKESRVFLPNVGFAENKVTVQVDCIEECCKGKEEDIIVLLFYGFKSSQCTSLISTTNLDSRFGVAGCAVAVERIRLCHQPA